MTQTVTYTPSGSSAIVFNLWSRFPDPAYARVQWFPPRLGSNEVIAQTTSTWSEPVDLMAYTGCANISAANSHVAAVMAAIGKTSTAVDAVTGRTYTKVKILSAQSRIIDRTTILNGTKYDIIVEWNITAIRDGA
jgi:hypothetical protein